MAVFNGDGAGNLFNGTSFDDIMNGFGGDDSLNGLGGNDFIAGGRDRDVISGGSGDDVLRVGAGEVVATEFYSGGVGTDTLLVSSIFPSSLVVTADFRTSTLSSLEKLTFEGGNRHNVQVNSSQIGTGLSSALAVNGGTGSNSIAVTMNGASLNLGGWSFANWGTNDGITINGTAAAETITGSSQIDYIRPGDGKDSIFAGAGDDKIEVGQVVPGSVFDGGTGIDTLIATQDSVDLTASQLTSIEKLVFRGSGEGESHNVMVDVDQFIGNGLSFQLQLDGVVGDVNTLTIFMNSQSSSSLNGLVSIDTQADMRVLLIGDNDAEQLNASDLNDTVSGNGGNDDISGYDGNDTLNGGGGDDIMKGGDDNDTYFVNSLGDQVIEKDFSVDDGGIDLVHVTGFSFALGEFFENLSLHGGDIDGTGNGLDNIIVGTGGDNILKGAAGNDTLNGGRGIDTLIGGQGEDSFVFTSILDAPILTGTRERILDFVSGSETIDVSAIDANLSLAGDQAFVLDTDGVLGIGEVMITTNATGNFVLLFNNDIGSGADMQIQVNSVNGLLGTDLLA